MVEDEVSEDSDQTPLGDEPIIALPPAVRKSLQVEANSLCPRFYHRPKKPFCEACRRAKMKAEKEVCRLIPEYDDPMGSAGQWGPHRTHT